jgi:hypothetical protein
VGLQSTGGLHGKLLISQLISNRKLEFVWLETTDWTGIDGFVEYAILRASGGKAIGIFLIGWGDVMGARIGGNGLSTAYTST